MDDRFKFRAYISDENEIIHFNTATDTHGYHLSWWECSKISKPALYRNSCLYQKEWELMQCTGLKDKNDKLIFEGDILKNNVNNLIQYVIYNQPQCEFSLKHTDEETRERKSFWLGSLWKSDIKNLGYEIIGNIYEHPELIEEESCNNCEKSGLCHCSKMDEDNVGCVAGRCGEYKRAVKE